MPQLSLYLSDDNLAALRARAEEENISLSKHVSRLIEQDAENHGWPAGFWGLYGAIDDASFAEAPDNPPTDDAEFETLFA